MYGPEQVCDVTIPKIPLHDLGISGHGILHIPRQLKHDAVTSQPYIYQSFFCNTPGTPMLQLKHDAVTSQPYSTFFCDT